MTDDPTGNASTRSAAHATALAPVFEGPVLLATDGSCHADGAAALALELARARHAELQVLTVLEPTTSMPTSRSRHERIEQERHARRMAAVREQLERSGHDGLPADVVMADGAAVATIAAVAAEREAALVVLGLHGHGFLDRVFHDETTLRVLRRVRTPLLAVTASLRALPRRAVVAVDFGASSVAAARAASRVLADGGTLRLVHIVADSNREGDDAFDAAEQLAVVAAEIEGERPVHAECVVRRGAAHAELEHELRDAPAELLALGCRRCAPDSAAPGRLASTFIRAAERSLLVAPSGAAATARSREEA